MYNIMKLSKAVKTYMEISIVHITSNDIVLLKQHQGISIPTDFPVGVSGFLHRYWVYLDTEELKSNTILYIVWLRKVGFSEAFCDLVRAAHQLKCDFIVFDYTGPIFDEPPIFN